MKRSLPILILLILTLVSGGGAYGLNTLIGMFAAPPEASASAAAAALASSQAPRPAAPPRALSAEQYLNGIMGRNLFDVNIIAAWAARTGTTGTSGDTRSELKVRLLGTIVASPETFSSALIADEEQPDFPKGYSIGDNVYDRVVLTIEKKRVTLKKPNGEIEILTIDDTITTVAPPKGAEPSDGDDSVQETGDNQFSVAKDLFDKYINDIEGISRMGRALLHRGPDGEFDGYRLSAIRRNTLADQLGIKNGDIIHSVNGEGLNSVQSAMNAYNTMKTQSNFCFEITRRGSPVELCYDVQ